MLSYYQLQTKSARNKVDPEQSFEGDPLATHRPLHLLVHLPCRPYFGCGGVVVYIWES